MSDLRKLLTIIDDNQPIVNETVAGSIAAVAMPMGETRKRVEEDTPEMPEVLQFGNWQNTALVTGEKTKTKRKKKPVSASVYGSVKEGKEEKIAGRYTPAEFDEKVKRLRDKAKKNPVDINDLARRMQAAYKKQDEQGVKEGSDDDIWGPQGRFAGDENISISTKVSLPKWQIGLPVLVKHLGQKGEIASLGKDSAIVNVGMRQYRVPLDGLARYSSKDVSEGFENAIHEAELSEEQLLASELRKRLELFKHAADRELGKSPEDKAIQHKVKESGSTYKKLIIRDLQKWLKAADAQDYNIQKSGDGHYQAWRDHNGAPHITGFWFTGNEQYDPEFWLRVPKTSTSIEEAIQREDAGWDTYNTAGEDDADLMEESSDYVGNAIEDLRVSMPGLEREEFLDELYGYIDARYGKSAADAAFGREDDQLFDEWFANYID